MNVMNKTTLWALLWIVGTLLAACTAAGPTPTPIVQAPPTETPAALEDVVVERVEVRILESFPVQVHVAVHGLLPDACSLIEDADQVREGDTFWVTLQIARRADARSVSHTGGRDHSAGGRGARLLLALPGRVQRRATQPR
jgi:inhibitor of cysteine peptidase